MPPPLSIIRFLPRLFPNARIPRPLLRPRPPEIHLPRLAVNSRRAAHNRRTLISPAEPQQTSSSLSFEQSQLASSPNSIPPAAAAAAAAAASTVPQFEKKRSSPRTTAAKAKLRRANDPHISHAERERTRMCTAYCTAEKYDLQEAYRILKRNGYLPDPFKTGLRDNVIHLRIGLGSSERTTIPPEMPVSVGPGGELAAELMELGEGNTERAGEGRHPLDDETAGDIFIFPSGNLVSWSVPEPSVSQLALTLQPAATHPYTEEVETEDLEYSSDPSTHRSSVRGDIIVLGTEPSTPPTSLVLAKIAFSSGLARSTKLAWLEDKLETYLASIRTIPENLASGGRLPFTRKFILQKTGELLSFRADLNLYSELTDSLPDIFWDSRHELGLEGYYGGVGRALDVESRIGALNRKLDYATEIVGVLRERLSELQGLWLEWCIIGLIAVEVGFESFRLWKERRAEIKERDKERERERKDMGEGKKMGGLVGTA